MKITWGTFCFAVLTSVSLSTHAGQVQFTAQTFSGNENVTPLAVTLERTGNATLAATVVVTSSNATATAGSDYTAVLVTVSWSANDSATKTVNIPVSDDRLVEGDEIFTLALSGVTGDTLGANTAATITIVDYEQGVLQFDSAEYEVLENAGTATITVSRSDGRDGVVTVKYATANKTATAPAFYTTTTGTLNFADGVTSQTFAIPIIDNLVGQGDKTVGLTLNTVAGGALAGERMSATLTIKNDDADFTEGLTRITPVKANVTQSPLLNLSQASPLNSKNTLLQTINRVPELTITSLTAAQGSTGIMTIAVGDNTYHLLPYRATKLSSSPTSAIYLDQDFSGRIITDEGLQIDFQPSLAAVDVLLAALVQFELPKLEITEEGNITIQRNQGPPPLEVDSTGKLVINNSFYDRFNLRPAIVSSVVSSEDVAGVYLLPHPNPLLPNDVYMQIVYTASSKRRQQLLTTAPAIADEYIAGLLALNGVSNVQFGEYGMSTFTYNDRVHRMYADLIVRRVDPLTYAGHALNTGLFSIGDVNGDGTDDFRMVYSNGDEQYFLYFPPL